MLSREEVIWSTAFAVHFDDSAKEAFVQMRTQTTESFREACEAHTSRQAMIAARKADDAVLASRTVDALALGEGVF